MRSSPDQVRAVMDTGLSTNEIQLLLSIANKIVTNNLGTDTTLDDETKKHIETYFTAHLIAIGKERQTKLERVDDVWVEYQGQFGASLDSTTFGQAVKMLDTTGNMANAAKMKATIKAIEQNPDRIIPS